jgi:hypothetical protein
MLHRTLTYFVKRKYSNNDNDKRGKKETWKMLKKYNSKGMNELSSQKVW